MQHWTNETPAGTDSMELVAPDGRFKARVYRDGRIDFLSYHQPGGETFDLLQISDLTELVARLESLRTSAKAHFGRRWPERHVAGAS